MVGRAIDEPQYPWIEQRRAFAAERRDPGAWLRRWLRWCTIHRSHDPSLPRRDADGGAQPPEG